MKRWLAIGFVLVLVALAVITLSFFLIPESTHSDKDTQDSNITQGVNTTKDKDRQRPLVERIAQSPHDPPYWLFFFRHEIPCTDDKLPLPSGWDYCPPDWIPDEGMIRDFDAWVSSTDQWKTTSKQASTFSITIPELQWYFEQNDPNILDGLENILRRGYLNIQLYFAQNEQSRTFQFSPNPSLYECCYSRYSKHYLDRDPPYIPARDLLEQLKLFMQERDIPLDNVNFFLDIYDVVAATKVKTLRYTAPEDYAREVMEHIKEIQKIIPNKVYVHEHSIWKEPYDLIPEEQKPLSGDQIKNQIRALAKEAEKYNASVGVMIDAVITDPRPAEDACRQEIEEHYPEDNGLQGIQPLIPVAREAGIPVGVFIHPYQDVRQEKNDPCNFPQGVEDVYASYMASARAIADVSLDPDFFVFASWTYYPNYALPETQPYTVTNMLLDVVEVIEGK